MKRNHKLLQRQIKKHVPAQWLSIENEQILAELFTAISQSYEDFESDRNLIERVMDLSSKELLAANQSLRSHQSLLTQTVEERTADLRVAKDVAEKASQTKSLFLANISHELRTPMHGILSFARFGLQKIDSSSKEKLKSYFEEIYQSGMRLMDLLNDLLDLSKLEAGKTVYSMNEQDLVETVRTVQAELGALAEEKGLKFEETTHHPLVIAFFDREKIIQVIRNLISNAIKFSAKGTSIQIEFDQTPEKIFCKVINYGVGIPTSELETIFDKFVQSSVTRTGAGGTGLGLAICKEIIEQHGGKIHAESEAGKTCFTFELPQKGGA